MTSLNIDCQSIPARPCTAYVRAIAPYQPGKPISELAREMGLEEADIVKLASNENPLGVSPRAQRAIAAALADLARYPDGNGFELKRALSRRYRRRGREHRARQRLERRARAGGARVPRAGTSAVYSQHAFAVYPLAMQARGARGDRGAGARLRPRPRRDGASGARRHRVVLFIANPNNPTGTFVAAATSSRRSSRAARARAGGARRGLQRVPAARAARRQHELAQAVSATWSSRAPSPRSTGSPGCAWATRSRIPRSPTS